MKCGNCKFWSKYLQIFHDNLYGVCEEIIESEVHEEKDAIAYVSDCGDGGGPHTLHTKFEFGCVLFEEK